MIGISKLYCGTITPGDPLRYGRDSTRSPAHLLQFTKDKKPVVVWNVTRRCNLNCIHCYSDSRNQAYPGELDDDEARKFINDIAEFKAPVILYSGGEPLLHPHIFDYIELASDLGVRPVLSTNGTLITKEIARRLKDAGTAYVGISLDAIGENNDRFRGKKGAFKAAIEGIRSCVSIGQKVGLRLTLTKRNLMDLEKIFRLIEDENIDRACFYHLVYAGRGSDMLKDDITHQETRDAVDLIIDKAKQFHEKGLEKEILTVDNHTDGPYLYMRMLHEKSERADEVYKLLLWNGGNSSGIGIADVDNLGNVHADQFWWDYSFGNVRERKFGDIWTDTSDPIMAGLKNRKPLLKGRCARCKWLNICNGNFRVRAKAVYNDIWMQDPACYLTDEEIGTK